MVTSEVVRSVDCVSEGVRVISIVCVCVYVRAYFHFACRQLLDLPTMKSYDRSRCFVDTDVSSQAEDDFTVSVCCAVPPLAPCH